MSLQSDKTGLLVEVPDSQPVTMTPIEAAAFEDFRLAARRLLTTKAEYEAAQVWYANSVKKLSEAAGQG